MNSIAASTAEVVKLNDPLLTKEEEPHFLLNSNCRLSLALPVPERRLLNHLNYQIKQSPHTLIHHVRKIIFCQQHDIRRELFPALRDLFLILGNKGQPLKVRLLKRSKSMLSPSEFNTLKQTISSPNNDTAVSDSTTVLNTSDNNEPEDLATLIENFIQNCQLDEAIEALEQHLIEEPYNKELSNTLISLYRACNETNRMINFIYSLEEKGPLPIHWSSLKSQIIP